MVTDCETSRGMNISEADYHVCSEGGQLVSIRQQCLVSFGAAHAVNALVFCWRIPLNLNTVPY